MELVVKRLIVATQFRFRVVFLAMAFKTNNFLNKFSCSDGTKSAFVIENTVCVCVCVFVCMYVCMYVSIRLLRSGGWSNLCDLRRKWTSTCKLPRYFIQRRVSTLDLLHHAT